VGLRRGPPNGLAVLDREHPLSVVTCVLLPDSDRNLRFGQWRKPVRHRRVEPECGQPCAVREQQVASRDALAHEDCARVPVLPVGSHP
jgi:hypothetical protein